MNEDYEKTVDETCIKGSWQCGEPHAASSDENEMSRRCR